MRGILRFIVLALCAGLAALVGVGFTTLAGPAAGWAAGLAAGGLLVWEAMSSSWWSASIARSQDRAGTRV